ncbi:helix-turn-helix transcriptional regulator [Nocardia sp. NPDC052112]|uniref:helix-turn-helix domain-containing protein n=1 Tax=Nocardia sp. NPDC052112 TaxID=3155646 RepID=UPI003442A857
MPNNQAAVENSTNAADRLASEIKRLRKAGGFSQPALANLLGYTRQYVSRAERAHNLPSEDLVRALDRSLAADGHLLSLWREAKVEQSALRTARTTTPLLETTLTGIDHESSPPKDRGEQTLRTPAGRYFGGSITPVIVVPAAINDGRIVATPTDSLRNDPILVRPHYSLILAAITNADEASFYGLDRRRALTRLTASNPGAPLMIPRAYLLDEFTLALAWAVTNLDNSLLEDDAQLAAAMQAIAALDAEPRSTAGHELAADLSPVSQMWLGSDFCARHILRHTDQLTDTPEFWTREQRGEEASTWLLFTHKFQYLQRTGTMSSNRDSIPTRTFCIPPETVSASWKPERILLLLTAALIESFGIRVEVCVEPEYTATQGFVLDPGRNAIIATWSNSDRIWHVDTTDHRPTVREFDDATRWARTHSIIDAPTPGRRLCTLADFLDLDWPWLIRRSRELSEYGAAGFTQPRSRLLSLAGFERACRFIADLDRQDR